MLKAFFKVFGIADYDSGVKFEKLIFYGAPWETIIKNLTNFEN